MMRRGAVLCLIGIAVLTVSPTALRADPVQRRYTFSDSPWSADWRLRGGESPSQYCRTSDEGLRCRIPPGPHFAKICGIDATFSIRGDFAIVAGFKIVAMPIPNLGSGAAAKISIKDRNGEWVSLRRQTTTQGQELFAAHRGILQPDGEYKHSATHRMSKAMHGRLRVQRVAGVVSYAVVEGDADEFITLRTEKFSEDVVTQILLGCETGGGQTGIEAIWTDVEVTADELAVHGPQYSPPTMGGTTPTVMWLGVTATIALVYVCSVIAIGRWRRAGASGTSHDDRP